MSTTSSIQTIFRDHLFAGKSALITGGGTGIGLRCARELARLGAKVVLAGRTREKLEQAVAGISEQGGEAHAVVCNIREAEDIESGIAESIRLMGGLDLLVNNAGGQFPSPAEDIPRKGWNAVIDTNLTGTFFTTQEAFRQHMRSHGGAVVNIIADMWQGFPMMAHTGAARAGVDNLTKTLANEWGRHGIRINAVAPGIIETSGLERYDPMVRPFIEEAAKNNQTRRMGTEAEVAAAVTFLLSPAASYITGVTLRVDGGQSIFHPLCPPQGDGKMPVFEDTFDRVQDGSVP
ncbi:SDR family oxidoreductase [Sulfidibacter corallicola]|uniref:Peroxisomal trans-2-enoyl-CoA reductase n=1 Tax=Sulfidibacter corallicola TaxID=2818388 RepID=A0A8A4TR65_SULCO|nr:SDR family oxidoreductase [Sulfidibacter corallicola]QTD51582.1 SDR family oxidoreductase [Sulfidibacter corallicola]